MPKGSSADRIATFRDVWNGHAESLSVSLHFRLDLEANLASILTRINRDWYGPEEVQQNAEAVASEIPDSLSACLERASSHHLEGLNDRILDAVESDRDALDDALDLETVLRENINSESLEQAIEDTDYEIQSIRSTLFSETASIARWEEKKSLNLYDLCEEIQACRRDLESSEFQTRYRRELVNPIQHYLRGEEVDIALDDLIPELFGELYSAGWESDSVEEAIEILDAPDDIEEFCDVLRGKKYRRKYCVPLPSDKLPKPHLHVAGVDFYMEDSDDFTYLEDFIEVDERVQETVDLVTQDTSFFAVFQLVAPTQEVGEKRMETKLERAIDALNHGKRRGVVQSPFTQRRTTYFCRLSNGGYRTHFSNHNKFAFPFNSWFDNKQIVFLETEFDFFHEERDDQTNLEKRFIQSYRWYGDGIQSGISEDEFLKYMISMESMLVPEDYGKKKGKLAERLADVLGVYDEYRDSFKDGVTELYDTRSQLVHSAEIDIPDIDDDISSARDKATRMFSAILTHYLNSHENIHELLDTLEEQEIPEAPDDFNPFPIR